jgi:hypothetical protein
MNILCLPPGDPNILYVNCTKIWGLASGKSFIGATYIVNLAIVPELHPEACFNCHKLIILTGFRRLDAWITCQNMLRIIIIINSI